MSHKRLGHAGPCGVGQSQTYTSWREMIQRCTNPKSTSFKSHGARGIAYDPKWHHFEEFLSDMGDRPAKHTLDRRDYKASYSKANCYWATPYERMMNRRAQK